MRSQTIAILRVATVMLLFMSAAGLLLGTAILRPEPKSADAAFLSEVENLLASGARPTDYFGGSFRVPNLHPIIDTDGDGCADKRENGPDETLGGQRDYKNPWDFYDVLGSDGGPRDGIIDLSNDILGVILHFSPFGYTPGTPSVVGNTTYDVFDRGPRVGGGPYNMGPPDGFIDLPNDILGVILQFNHDCVSDPVHGFG
ncbi:MAG: hypothetical protein IIC91_12280 [Chloroflexi bacterium]|nr:hypothetical protein [Chloroflexota bacterium]